MSRSRTGQLLAAVVALAVLAAALLFVVLSQGPGTASPSPPASVEPTAGATLNEEMLSRRLTVLVIGLDSDRARREAGHGVNTDTLMLASVDADQSEVTLISLPRDTVDIPMPDGSTWERKVNAIHAERGVDELVGAMETLFDVPIDGYLQIDMDDLVTLVDAAGGVTVSPDEPLADPIVDLDLAPGEQQLDGATALSYVRTRVDSDYGRAARQQEVLLDLVSRLVSPGIDVDVATLLSGLDSFETSLPLDDLPTLVEIGRKAQDARVKRQVLDPPEFISFEGDAGDGRGYILKPDVEAIRGLTAEALEE